MEIGDKFARTIAFYDPRFGKVRVKSVKHIVAETFTNKQPGRKGQVEESAQVLCKTEGLRKVPYEKFNKPILLTEDGFIYIEVWSTWEDRKDSELIALNELALKWDENAKESFNIVKKVNAKMKVKS